MCNYTIWLKSASTDDVEISYYEYTYDGGHNYYRMNDDNTATVSIGNPSDVHYFYLRAVDFSRKKSGLSNKITETPKYVYGDQVYLYFVGSPLSESEKTVQDTFSAAYFAVYAAGNDYTISRFSGASHTGKANAVWRAIFARYYRRKLSSC